MSIWDSFKSTFVRLAHYLNNADDKHIKKCGDFDKNLLFSITKKADKFAGAVEFNPSNDLKDKPVLKQAKIVAGKFKEVLTKERQKSSYPSHNMGPCLGK